MKFRRCLTYLLFLAVTGWGLSANAQQEETSQVQVLVEDATALFLSGDPAAALAGIDDALELARQSADTEAESNVLHIRGLLQARQGKHREALVDFEQALSLAREREDRDDEADVLGDIARAYTDLKEVEPAIEALTTQLPILVATGDRAAEAECLHTLGVLRSVQKDRGAEAVKLLLSALVIWRELGDAADEAHTLDNLGQVQTQLGRTEESLAYYREALAIKRQLGDPVGVDEILRKIARVEARRDRPASPPSDRQRRQSDKARKLEDEGNRHVFGGDPRRARSKFKRAVSLFQKAGNRRGEAGAQAGFGLSLFMLNEYEQALVELERAVHLARRVADRDVEANALNNIGLVYLAQGNLAQGLNYLERSLALWRQGLDRSAELRTLGNIAVTQLALGDLAKAEAKLRQLLERQGRRDRVTTLANLGAVLARQQKHQAALEIFEQALTLRTNDVSLRIAIAGNVGTLHALLGDYDRALEIFDQVLARQREIGDRQSESDTLSNIGLIHSLRGSHTKALDFMNQALAVQRELALPRHEANLRAKLGRVYLAMKQPADALGALQRSIEIQEALWATARGEQQKIGLGEQISELYDMAVPLLMEFGRADEAFELAERARARTFLDQLGNDRPAVDQGGGDAAVEELKVRRALAGLDHLLTQEQSRPRSEQDTARVRRLTAQLTAKQAEHAELVERLQRDAPEYASLVSVSPADLAEVQGLVEPDTTLVAYFVTDEKTLAFVVTNTSFEAIDIPVGREELAAAIAEFRDFPTVDGPPSPALGKLYEWLVAPLRAALNTPYVAVVPHGPLHLLPFSALYDGQNWFGADLTLFRLPSASTLRFVREKRRPIGGDLLAIAHNSPAGLPPLRYAKREAEAIAGIYNGETLIGAAATETALRSRAPNIGILHIAAHGQLNVSTPIFSRIVLKPDEVLDRSGDGMLEVGEIYNLSLERSSLVVLSACQTQLGNLRGGDEIVGLNRAFFYAGAPSVVATLWSVDDRATAVLMTSFYQHLRRGVNKAAALQAAQAETRRDYPDPYFWAAFVLNGDHQ